MAVAALVDTVARRLTEANLSEVEDRARRYVLWHFAETGRAPRLLDLQRELQLGLEDDAVAILIRLHKADLIIYDTATARISAAYPFSNKPTSHRVEIGDRTVYALCAIDALGIPFMLDAPALIRSECFWCHAPVEVHVEDGGISKHQPGNLVAWYPERRVATAWRHPAVSGSTFSARPMIWQPGGMPIRVKREPSGAFKRLWRPDEGSSGTYCGNGTIPW